MNLRIIFLLLFIISSFNVFANNFEEDCAKAALAFLREKGVLGGGDNGLCVSTLDELPRIDIGLGSRTFPLGNDQKFNVSSQTTNNLRTMRELLSGAAGPGGSFSFVGFADGVANRSSSYDGWLEGKEGFTKDDLRKSLKGDPNSLNVILELLKDKKNDEKILKNDSDPNVAKAVSIIRNNNLGYARAKRVCEIALGEDVDCTKQVISGFASPRLELDGHKQCGGRRRAVMSFDLGDMGVRHSQGGNGTLFPSIPSPDGMQQRNMQIASSLDLFKKLKDKEIPLANIDKNPLSVESILPDGCKSESNMWKVNAQNAIRLVTHVNERLSLMPDSARKRQITEMISTGNYRNVKKELDTLNEKKGTPQFSPTDQEVYDVLEILVTGYDVRNHGDSFKRSNANSSKVYSPVNSSLGKIEVRGDSNEVIGVYDLKVFRTGPSSVTYVYVDPERGIRFTDKGQRDSNDPSLFVARSSNVKFTRDFDAFDSRFPDASGFSPSTDYFNCFSTASALAETIHSDNGMQVLEPSLLTGSDELNIRLHPNRIKSRNNEPNGTKGWICQACSSGVQIDNQGKLIYRQRASDQGASTRSVNNQRGSKELTMGSMKYPKIFNISRNSLGDNCSGDKNVCTCFKEMSREPDQLQKILESSHTKLVDIPSSPGQYTKSYDSKVKFENNQNHCLFIPPIPHTCRVDPVGGSADRRNLGRQAAMSCKLLDKIKEKYNLSQPINIDVYKNKPIGNALCTEALKVSDEEGCGLTITPNSSSSGGGVRGY